MNRLRYTFIQCFCLFLLLFFGCSNQVQTPFFQKFEVRQNRVKTKVHRAETFPRSLKLEGIKQDLLLAGTREGLSFFVEYYELEMETPQVNQLVEGPGWYKDSKGTHFQEKEFSILNENHLEIRFLRREPPYIIYGSFLMQADSEYQLQQFMPELYEEAITNN